MWEKIPFGPERRKFLLIQLKRSNKKRKNHFFILEANANSFCLRRLFSFDITMTLRILLLRKRLFQSSIISLWGKAKKLKIENVTAFLIDFISEGNQRRFLLLLLVIGNALARTHLGILWKVDNFFYFLQNWMKRTWQLCDGCCCCFRGSFNEHFSRIVLCNTSKLWGPFRAIILSRGQLWNRKKMIFLFFPQKQLFDTCTDMKSSSVYKYYVEDFFLT